MPDRVGPGRVLALAYGFFTLAAGARSAVQLAGHPHRALTAYVLSAVAAAVYLSGTLLVAQADRGRWRRAAVVVCLAEVTGVVGVGTLSLARPDLFPDASVWSGYGSGYGYVPAVLPLLALGWLHRLRLTRHRGQVTSRRRPGRRGRVGPPHSCGRCGWRRLP